MILNEFFSKNITFLAYCEHILTNEVLVDKELFHDDEICFRTLKFVLKPKICDFQIFEF